MFESEVLKALLRYPQRTSKLVPESYIGGGKSNLIFLGLKAEHLKDAQRKGFSFSDRSPLEQAKIWTEIWCQSRHFEVMSLALSWFDHPRQRALTSGQWGNLKSWARQIDNWAHADTLSGIYARFLEDHPERTYRTLKIWNSSQNPWLRRLSIVSLLHYSSARQKLPSFPKIIALIEPQIGFPEHYVQRGVGWSLRETHNVYPKQTLRFLQKNVHLLSSIAFSAATEKMTKAQKDHLKALRSVASRECN